MLCNLSLRILKRFPDLVVQELERGIRLFDPLQTLLHVRLYPLIQSSLINFIHLAKLYKYIKGLSESYPMRIPWLVFAEGLSLA